METQVPKTSRRWVSITAVCIASAAFVVSCSALMVAIPHPDQYRVAPVGVVPTQPMPPVAQPEPAAPTTAWDVEHIYQDGQYEVGKDIYEGKWKTAGKVPGPMGCSIIVRAKDGNAIDDIKYGDGLAYIQVHNGEFVQVSNCQTLTLVSAIPK
jgi:hypothetical protein